MPSWKICQNQKKEEPVLHTVFVKDSRHVMEKVVQRIPLPPRISRIKNPVSHFLSSFPSGNIRLCLGLTLAKNKQVIKIFLRGHCKVAHFWPFLSLSWLLSFLTSSDSMVLQLSTAQNSMSANQELPISPFARDAECISVTGSRCTIF